MNIKKVKEMLSRKLKEQKETFPVGLKNIFLFPDHFNDGYDHEQFSYTAFWNSIQEDINYIIENNILVSEYCKHRNSEVELQETEEILNLLVKNCGIKRISPYNINKMISKGFDESLIKDFSKFDSLDLCEYLKVSEYINNAFPFELITPELINEILSEDIVKEYASVLNVLDVIEEIDIKKLTAIFVSDKFTFQIAYEDHKDFIISLYENKENHYMATKLLEAYPDYICRFNYRNISEYTIRQLVKKHLPECNFFLSPSYIEEHHYEYTILLYFEENAEKIKDYEYYFPIIFKEYSNYKHIQNIIESICVLPKEKMTEQEKHIILTSILNNMSNEALRGAIRNYGTIIGYIPDDIIVNRLDNIHNLWSGRNRREGSGVYGNWEIVVYDAYKKHTNWFLRRIGWLMIDKKYKQ